MEARSVRVVNWRRMASHLQVHEALFLVLGIVLTFSLSVHHGVARGVTLSVTAATVTYAGIMLLSQKGARARLVASAMVTWLLYVGSSEIIEALHLPVRSARVLAWDTWLLGGTPAVSWQGTWAPWMADVFSAAYLNYQVYIHWAFLSAWCISAAQRLEFMRWVFTTFVVGFSGYFLFPAVTPAAAFPELFAAPVQGGLITSFNEFLNARMAARYDAFPSMHVLVTMTLLAWDFQCYRVRFWIMLPPALLMTIGTLYLRLHYFTDIVASVALFVVLQFCFRLRASLQTAPSHAATSAT